MNFLYLDAAFLALLVAEIAESGSGGRPSRGRIAIAVLLAPALLVVLERSIGLGLTGLLPIVALALIAILRKPSDDLDAGAATELAIVWTLLLVPLPALRSHAWAPTPLLFTLGIFLTLDGARGPLHQAMRDRSPDAASERLLLDLAVVGLALLGVAVRF